MVDDLFSDDAVLLELLDGPATCEQLASATDIPGRTVRLRLRHLIRGGYVFSPARGMYRITAAGWRAIEPVPKTKARRPSLLDATPREIFDRVRRTGDD
jgi:hypothetical protein